MTGRKRAHGDGTMKQRTDGRWEAQLTLPDGRRKSLYGKTQREARDKLREAIRERDAGLDVGSAGQPLAAFLDRWLADVVEPTLAPKTVASYRDTVRLHISPALGRIAVGKLTPQHVQGLLREKERAGLSPRTVAYIRAVLRSALTRATKWGLVSRNVAALADAPKQERKKRPILTPEQTRALIVACAGHRHEAVIRVGVALGLRQGEILGLMWSDIDLDARTLRVERTLQRYDGKLRLKEPKTERSRRTITLPASLIPVLRAHRTRQLEERLMQGSRWRDTGLVFTDTLGGPCEPANVWRSYKRLLRDAGLPDQRFHDLRHVAASLLIAQGVPARTVMEVLGHSQIATTMDIYAHVFAAGHQDAADAMDRALAG